MNLGQAFNSPLFFETVSILTELMVVRFLPKSLFSFDITDILEEPVDHRCE